MAWRQNFKSFQNRRKMKIDVIFQNRRYFKSFVKWTIHPPQLPQPPQTVGVINTILGWCWMNWMNVDITVSLKVNCFKSASQVWYERYSVGVYCLVSNPCNHAGTRRRPDHRWTIMRTSCCTGIAYQTTTFSSRTRTIRTQAYVSINLTTEQSKYMHSRPASYTISIRVLLAPYMKHRYSFAN